MSIEIVVFVLFGLSAEGIVFCLVFRLSGAGCSVLVFASCYVAVWLVAAVSFWAGVFCAVSSCVGDVFRPFSRLFVLLLVCVCCELCG